MKLTKRAIFSVCERLIVLNARPPLFNERMTPARLRRRLVRVEAWLGESGRRVVQEQMRSPKPIQPNKLYRKGRPA